MLKKIDLKIIKNVIFGLLALFGFVFLTYFLVTRVLDQDNLKSIVLKAGIFGPILFILVKASTLIVAPLGGTPVYIVAGLLYGFLPALFYLFIGDLLGSAVSFLLARKFGKRFVLKLLGNDHQRLDIISQKVNKWQVIILMALPFGLSDIINYAAGLTNIRFLKYLFFVVVYRVFADSFLVSLAFFPDQSSFIKILYGIGIMLYLGAILIFGHKLSLKIENILGGN